MQSSSIDPYGRRWKCPVCGHEVSADAADFGDATCACCGSLMWFDPSRRKRVRELRESLLDLGAVVTLDRDFHGWDIDLTGMRITLDQIESLPLLGRILELQLADTAVDDGALQTIGQLRSLQILELGNTRVTDAGLLKLERLTHLEMLGLNGTAISDSSAAQIVQFHRLWSLDLDHSQITDAALPKLVELQRLELLYLSGTRVGDAGISELGQLKELEELHLSGTQVTTQGIESLQLELPDCQIEWSN